MTFQWKKLYKELDIGRKQQGLSWRKLALLTSVTPSVYTRMSKGEPLSTDNLIKVIKGPEGTIALDIWSFVK